jgi:ABC-type multidrug transport system fused ATPase/permease subunit
MRNSERVKEAIATSGAASDEPDVPKEKTDEPLPSDVDHSVDDDSASDHDAAADDEDEHRDRGSVSAKAYVKYLRALGSIATLLLILALLIGTQLSNFFQDFFMAKWVQAMENGGSPRGLAMSRYAIAGASFVVCFAGGFTLRSLAQVTAAHRIHEEVLHTVLGAKVAWFDKTPVGRIQNRFSSDFQSVDRELCPSLYFFIFCCCNPIATIAAMATAAPALLVAIVPLVAYDASVARVYLGAARDTKRLASVNRSPIYEFFTESLNGLATLRAYESQRVATQTISSLIDASNRCDMVQRFAFRWLGIRLELFGALLGGVCALGFATFLRSIDPSFAGFVLAYANNM